MRAHLLAFVVFPGVAVLIGAGLFRAEQTVLFGSLLALYFLHGALMGVLLVRIRCPKCKRRATGDFAYTPRRCRHCGYDLSQRKAPVRRGAKRAR